MRHQVLDKVEELAGFLRENAPLAEQLGRLPDESVKRLKETGLFRMLQPKEFGGLEADPEDFFSAVMAAGVCGATGWVAGVVGVHPWELALMDRRVQEEIWGEDPDTLVASPYTPNGRAIPVDGGYQFSGRWGFSSGTDHCDWIVLGGIVQREGTDPTPADMLHFVLPRSDYEIVPDSWDVVGLRGTGSKDVIVRDAFVPDYRTIGNAAVMSGEASRASAQTAPLYHMPWSSIFPVAITAGLLGIAKAGVAEAFAHQRTRTNAFGVKGSTDPHVLAALGEAASEIDASVAQVMSNVREMFDIVSRGEVVPLDLRAKGRRDQVRSAWRAVEALDRVFGFSGGTGLVCSKPLQRLWRDAHTGLNHAVMIRGGAYETYSLSQIAELPANAFI